MIMLNAFFPIKTSKNSILQIILIPFPFLTPLSHLLSSNQSKPITNQNKRCPKVRMTEATQNP